MKELAVVGFPSSVGGAGTELNDQISCWVRMGIHVHLFPTGPLSAEQQMMSLPGCTVHPMKAWKEIDGRDVISFCSRDYLEALPEIRLHSRSTLWVNCMTWNFPKEVENHGTGLIDFHLYQTEHGRKMVGRALEGDQTRKIVFTPFFNADRFPFISDRPRERFRFGRLSRPAPDKFSVKQSWIYSTMTAPVPKAGLVMGWSDEVQKKCGPLESFVPGVPAGWTTSRAFFEFADALIMSTDTYENLPRVGFEAMASGTVLVVDDRGGWKSQVQHGISGWLCRNERDFVYRASRLAHEPGEMKEMREIARQSVLAGWGYETASESWNRVFAVVDALGPIKSVCSGGGTISTSSDQ